MSIDGRLAIPIETAVGPGLELVYRLYAADGALLYIGRTVDLRPRLRQHRMQQPWWPEVSHVTVEPCAEPFGSVGAESMAIEMEQPRWNKKLQLPTGPAPDLGGEPKGVRIQIDLAALARELATRGWSRDDLARHAGMNKLTLRRVYRLGWAALPNWTKITAALTRTASPDAEAGAA